ncbi:MAG: AAA family ATPase [Nanoarchaeota archaeon]|nr:AAA family ATPase [Nanoarchaeota archaeon]
MKFKSIKLKNIRSYKSQEIEFPEGSILLSGDVGSGKTTILLALEYALFGLQPGQKGSSLLRSNAKVGEVVLDLEINGKEIIIERKLKRSAKGVSNEFAAISIEGERIESSVTEIKSKVVSLIGYPLEFVKKNNTLYRYTVYTPQEQMKQIILEDIETRMNILRHIFGVDKYKTIQENLSQLITALKNDSKILQAEIKLLEQEKDNLSNRSSQLNLINLKAHDKEVELNEKIKNRKQCESELSIIEKRIEEKRTFEGEAEKTKILLGTKRETFALITRDINELNRNFLEKGEIYNEVLYTSIIKEISLKRDILEKTSTNYLETLGKIRILEQEKEDSTHKKESVFNIKICPTCLQTVSEVHKHNILNEAESKISEVVKQLENIKEENKEFIIQLEKIKKELKELENKKTQMEIIKSKEEYLTKTKQKITELEKQKQSLENDLSLLSHHLNGLKESILRYSAFDNQFKKKQLELKQAFMDEKNTEISLAELKKEGQMTQKEIELLKESILKREVLKQRLYKITDTIDWLSSQFANLIEFIERNVLLRLRNEFSRVFREWFLMLIPENTLDSNIDENFTPIIIREGAEMEYEFLSGGERTAVALAYRLALNQTINSVLSKIQTRGIVILDEPTEGFSESQIQKIRDILEQLNASQLIIVSHESKIEGFVENVLRVTKDGDTSNVELIASAPIV